MMSPSLIECLEQDPDIIEVDYSEVERICAEAEARHQAEIAQGLEDCTLAQLVTGHIVCSRCLEDPWFECECLPPM